MDLSKLGQVLFILLFVNNVISQILESENLYQTTDALNTFGINFLAETLEAGGSAINLALAPYTIWSLLSILAEGANGNTANEINRALQLPVNKELFRKSYRTLRNRLSERSAGVTLDVSNAIFTPDDQIIKKNFKDLTNTLYGVDIMPMDIKNIPVAVRTINDYMAKATRNRIPNFVNGNDLRDAEIFLTSAIFFKGQWATPFNRTSTHPESFSDENDNKIGNVQMMYLFSQFAYLVKREINAVALELPYGTGEKMSMIVLLPFEKQKLSNVIRDLGKYKITKLMNDLEEQNVEFPETLVHVYLPKFRIESDFVLNAVLDRMGIKELFNAQKADLINLSNNYLYVSRIIQKGFIDVDEDGTVATAASGAVLEDRIPPPVFRANKPFAYFIVEKKTKSVLFAGTVSNPNSISN